MEYRQLGTDGPQVLGLGAWPLGHGMGYVADQVAVDTVRAAIDAGITLVDTAQAYWTSEATLSKALKDGYRERCFLATKVSRDYSRQGIMAAMEASLRALHVDYVDLYQIHSWGPQHPIEESMEAMARLQEQGKARFIGVSNFSANQMARAQETALFQSNQPRYSMFDREFEDQDMTYCAQEGIGILTHSSLAKGLLTGKYAPGHVFADDDERSGFGRFQGQAFADYLAVVERLREVASDKGLTMIQLAVAWVLRTPTVTCTLVGAKNPAQAQEPLGAVGVTFEDDELEAIESALAAAPDVPPGPRR